MTDLFLHQQINTFMTAARTEITFFLEIDPESAPFFPRKIPFFKFIFRICVCLLVINLDRLQESI